MNNPPIISETDLKILKALLKDARTNFTEIAKQCGVSTTAIAQRYKKLRKNKTITGTTLITNTKKKYSLSIDMKYAGNCEQALKAIKNIPGTLHCFRVIGRYNIHAAVKADSLEQADQIRNTIRKEKGVTDLEITTSLDEHFLYPENLLKTPK